jgi:hypothetical protein
MTSMFGPFVRIMDFVADVKTRTDTGAVSPADARDEVLANLPWHDLVNLRDACIALQGVCEQRMLHWQDSVNNGVCRYCGRPRPAGYSVTCGGSDCQEAAYRDEERRA